MTKVLSRKLRTVTRGCTNNRIRYSGSVVGVKWWTFSLIDISCDETGCVLFKNIGGWIYRCNHVCVVVQKRVIIIGIVNNTSIRVYRVIPILCCQAK